MATRKSKKPHPTTLARRRARVREAADVLGGVDGVEQLTGALRTAIFNWLAEGQFPARYYVVMSTALMREGHPAPHWMWGQQGNHKINRLAA